MTQPVSSALRPAATVVVVRDAPDGPEVLLLRRAERGDHNSGAWVFPGGLVDSADRQALPYCIGLDAAAADALLGLPDAGAAYFIAALRECFEEAGLLLAADADGRLLPGAAVERLADWRGALARGDRSLAALCAHEQLRLPLDRVVYLSHWVTPLGRPKRFDTRFFLAEAPAGQTALHDDGELVEQRWLRPAQALTEGAAMKLLTPTLRTLESLAVFDSVSALMAWARGPRVIRAGNPTWAPTPRARARWPPTNPPGPRSAGSTPTAVAMCAATSDRACRCTSRRT